MVVPSPTPLGTEKVRAVDLPVIDLYGQRSEVSKLIVKACDKYGFFKVINHGVPNHIVAKLEEECLGFFAKTMPEKQKAGPANPFGYGYKTIGFKGDMGEIEYLTLNTNPLFIAERSKSISDDPLKFRYLKLLFSLFFYTLQWLHGLPLFIS